MTEENKPQETTPQIGLRDIAFAVEVLKVASRRGAFELNELKSVGELGERFSAFVETNKPASTDLEDVGEDGSPAEEEDAVDPDNTKSGEPIMAEGAD
tara:strand:+ start:8895 stop:9188 length:294 start_codon:yes stop_codon:yes gene_type:complete